MKFFDDNGFGDIIRKNDNQTVMNMRFVVDTKDIDDIEQKIARLKEFKEFLADNGFKNTGLYQGVTSSIDRYSDQQNNELEAADILVNNIIKNLSDSNEKLQAVSVESVQSFEEYRKKMLEELLKDNDISTALSSGLLSKEDLQKSIDGFMATCEDFSAQYEQWQNRLMGQKQDIDSPLSLSDLLNTEDLADTKKELIELAKAGELTPETFNSTKEYRDLLQQTGLTAKQAYLEMMNLDDFDMDLSDWQSQLQNARSNISELNDMMDELTSKDSTGLSSSSVDKIISDFPQLLQYLNDTPRLIEEINSLLNGQKDIANDAANQMLEYNSSAYIQMRDTAQAAINDITVMQNGQVQSVAQMYGIDLNNYSSLAQAKKAIELALLGTLNEGWAQHFGVVIDSLTGMAKITQSLDGSDPRTAEALSQISAYNELMTRLNSAKKNFENNIDYGSVGANKSKSKGSDKKETDKWLEEYKKKLAELQNQLDKGKRKCPLL